MQRAPHGAALRAVVLEKHGLDLADSATESTFAQESKDGVDTEPGCDEPPS